jgi:protein SCO1/2
MLLLLAGYGAFTLWRVAQANRRYDPAVARAAATKTAPPPRKDVKLEDFSFSDQLGRRVELKQFKGKVWVASFFFASCPGPCTMMNQAVAKLRSELGAGKLGENGVTFVSVTVDPLNDTPDRLARYADHFQADPKSWLFLTGPYESARSLGEDLLLVTVDGQRHSERLILIDRDGEVVRTYHATQPLEMEELKQKIETLLARPALPKTKETDAPQPAEEKSTGEQKQSKTEEGKGNEPAANSDAKREPS